MSHRTVTTIPVPGMPELRLVGIDGHVFTGAIHGGDPTSGVLAASVRQQAVAAVRNLELVLARSGTRPEEIGLVTIGVAPGIAPSVVKRLWRAILPDAGAALRVNVHGMPGGRLVELRAVGLSGARPTRVPGDASGADGAPLAVRIGSLVLTRGVDGRDPSTGRPDADPEVQIRQAFENLRRTLAAAGASWDDLLHVYVFFRDRVSHQMPMDRIWHGIFLHGTSPARKSIEYDHLEAGSVLEFQAIAVVDGPARRNFSLPGVPDHTTGTLAAAIGRVFHSCGISGDAPGRENGLGGVEEQTGWTFAHLRGLMRLAGGTLDDVAHVTIMVRDFADVPVIDRHWRAAFPDPQREPSRQYAAFTLHGGRQEHVQLHAIAVI